MVMVKTMAPQSCTAAVPWLHPSSVITALWGQGQGQGRLTSVVAAACLDSSLRWLSILSTFASSSVLMYSVSVGPKMGVGVVPPPPAQAALRLLGDAGGIAAALRKQPG